MRQLGVPVERRLVRPYGMDGESKWLVERLEHMDGDATWLSPGWLDDSQQFLTKLEILSRVRFQADEKVDGQAEPPDDSISG